MAIDHLLEQLLDRIRHDPDLRRQLAQLLFGRELAQLADQLAQLASLVRSLAESTQQGFQLLAERSSLVERELATLRRVVGELAEQQRATTAQIAALTERMERVEGQIAQMTAAVALLALSVQRLDDHWARARSWYLEARMRDRAPAIFGSWMDTRRVVPPMEMRRLVRESLTRSQLQRLLDADIIVTGELNEHPATPTVWLVIDVSTTVDASDVERALARADLLRRVVPNVIPVVTGDQLVDQTRKRAEAERVVLVRDGTLTGWDEAIEQWVVAA